MYLWYDKIPWDLGYPHYEEIDALMPLFSKYAAEIRKKGKKSKKEQEAEADFNNLVSGHRAEAKAARRGLGK